MKEYLFKNSFGEYKQVDLELASRVLPLKHWVEIPDDAEVAVHLNCGKSSGVFFWKDGGDTIWKDQQDIKPYWVDCECSGSMSLCEFIECWQGGCAIVWERDKQQPLVETNKLLTKTPFTYDRLLGCYVEHYASCSNSGYIVSVRHNTIGEPVFEVEGSEWDYGILAKEVIFYTEDNQPLTFERYKEMYYGEV